MNITAVETIQADAFANLVWVRIQTDEGLVGIGETIRNPEATVAYVHETCAPYLLGKDPLRIEEHWDALMCRVGSHFNGFPSRSVELRGNSAVDIALWDLFGKYSELPVYQLLGGLCRDSIRVYNTCASPSYNTAARVDYDTEKQDPAALGSGVDDLAAQHQAPAELAQSLLDEGISAMKIWPLDPFALQTRGTHISATDLARGIAPVEKIRAAVGDSMDVMMEYHGLWQLPAAVEIAQALDELGVYWHEDPIAMYNFGDLQAFKHATRARLCGSENLGTTQWYREVFERRIIDVAHFALCWIGGITEGKRVAALANAYARPIAPHDCVGPITFAASLALVMSTPNALVQETVRAFYRGYYRDVVTEIPHIADGQIYPLNGVGLGTDLQPDFAERKGVRIRCSKI